jgi:hypothetical protein
VRNLRRASNGTLGYTVAQVRRLLDCADGTVRNKFKEHLLDEPGTQLVDAAAVDAARKALLARLGAREDDGLGGSDEAIQNLQERILLLEERLRLLTAARAAARERERQALAEEDAYMQAAILDLPAPR